MKFRRTILSVSIAAAVATLSACGGGGGGGGSPSPLIRPDSPTVSGNSVPFHTPVRVGTVSPMGATQNLNDISALFTENLSSTGGEIIVAGRANTVNGTHENYQLNIFGWNNGQLVNQTSQWFSGTDNHIIGNETSLKFGDFNGDGKRDMYAAPYTDISVYGPGAVFLNNGSNFSRVDLNLGNISAHDSAVYDMNRDGYSDILTMSFGPDVKLSFGSSNGTFTTYTNASGAGGGSGVAVADFLGNNTSTIIMTDSFGENRLFSWSINNGQLWLTQESVLPTSRFNLPKWTGYNFSGTHDIRALAFDFDNSGRTSAVIVSRPWITGGVWPNYSEVQFVKNQGNGVFTDVTDSVLVGYNTNTPASYNPQLMDVNSDGLIDIVLSTSTGSQVLVHTSEHKYVASYATVLQAFKDQALNQELQRTISAGGNSGIVFVNAPDGNSYLATTIMFSENGVTKHAVYLSKLGATATSAQATVNAIRQIWPWMSDAQVNSVLSSSSTTWFGLNVLDPSRAMNPVGSLQILVNDQFRNLSGSVSGLKLNSAVTNIKALDSLGRDFNIDYSVTSFNSPNMFSRFVETIDDDTRGAQISGMYSYRYNGLKFGGTADNRSMMLGVTGIEVYKNTYLSAQYTRLPFSPFVAINGAWGLVRASDTVETTISNHQGNFITKLGLMHSATAIDTGLVQRINPITSVWGEAGWRWEKFQVYGGVLPRVIGGSADLSLPTGIDNSGKITYTNTTVGITNPTVTYARFSYNDRINKHATYRISGMINSQQRNTVMGELKFNF